jgi:hypothetical protein
VNSRTLPSPASRLFMALAWICMAAGSCGALYCLPHREFATIPHLLGSVVLILAVAPLTAWSERLRRSRP